MSTQLVHYTSQKLTVRPSHKTPHIRVYSNGVFYIYKSVLKKINAAKKDDLILFSHDPKENKWYISSDPTGMPIKYSNMKSLHYFCSSELRDKFLRTHLPILKTVDNSENFYLTVASHPAKMSNDGHTYFEVSLIQ